MKPGGGRRSRAGGMKWGRHRSAVLVGWDRVDARSPGSHGGHRAPMQRRLPAGPSPIPQDKLGELALALKLSVPFRPLDCTPPPPPKPAIEVGVKV